MPVYKYVVSLATVTVTVTVTVSRLRLREVREEVELVRLGVGASGPLGTSCSGF